MSTVIIRTFTQIQTLVFRAMLRPILRALRRRNVIQHETTQQYQSSGVSDNEHNGSNTDTDTDNEDDVDSNISIHTAPPTTEEETEVQVESWVEWVRRCTHQVELKMKQLN